MSTMEADVNERIEELEKSLAVAETAQTGAQATQAAAMAGMGAAVIAGAAGLVIGMLLGALLSND
jgi:F0F1-type ATP synthase assembly protein I